MKDSATTRDDDSNLHQHAGTLPHTTMTWQQCHVGDIARYVYLF
jgi:hypothetical protein